MVPVGRLLEPARAAYRIIYACRDEWNKADRHALVAAETSTLPMDLTHWPDWESVVLPGERHASETASVGRRRAMKGVLTVGFVALSVSLLVAHANPATGYELSIYRATPVAFWFVVGISLACGLVASFSLRPGRLRTAALSLVVGAFLAITALPLVRGYFFFGGADALTHLGWTNELARGVFSPWAFLYPGIHTTTLFVGRVVGMPTRQAFHLVVLAFVVVYALFVPLCVGRIVDNQWAVPVGVFSALLLLPVNDISVFLLPHPTTQALLATPLVCYLAFEYVTGRRTPWSVTGIGALLAVSTAGYLLLHPQQTLNVLLVFGTFVVVQFGYRYRGDDSIADHRPLVAQAAFLAGIVLLWTADNDTAQGTTSRVIRDLLAIGVPVDEVAQRSGSLGAVGGSIEELFVKLFLVSLLYAILAGLFMLGSLRGRFESLPEDNAFGRYLTAAFVPLFGVFVALLVASHTTQHFRQVGFIMVVVTILGAAAIAYGVEHLSVRLPRRAVIGTVGACLAICLVLSTATVFFSPYIYQPSNHVTETELSGYETAFDHRAAGVPFTGIRYGVERQADTIYGAETASERSIPGDDAVVPSGVFERNLTSHYARERYLVVTRQNVAIDVGIYDGFRYSAAGFDALDTTPGLDRVLSNEEVDLYVVPGNPNANATDRQRTARAMVELPERGHE